MSFEISIVIPTYNRRDRLERCLCSLERQTLDSDRFEVVVVVDGSTDGTLELLERYSPPFELRYLRQDNRGLSAARNAGNLAAASDRILCVDDDMIATPGLVEAHLESHERHPGCLVQGALRIHESAKTTPFLRYQDERLRKFQQRQPLHGISARDVSGGNSSLDKKSFIDVGGFNEELKDLSDTDGELAHRLQRIGVPIIYNREALCLQTHVKDLEEHLSEELLYGRTYVYTQRRYPETIWRSSPMVHDRSSTLRNGMRRLLRSGYSRAWTFGWLEGLLMRAVRLAESLHWSAMTAALYRLSMDYYFWKGVHTESGGKLGDYVPRRIPILCFHHVSDINNAAFRPYILPVKKFKRQMNLLRRRGYRPISLDRLCRYLDHGATLPDRPVVITFDDGYKELKSTATPLLAGMGYAHTHFLNAGRIGRTTEWVSEAPDIPILGREDIEEMLRDHGDHVEIQAHGQTHRSFAGLDPESLREEVLECVETLRGIVGRAVDFLAYPYGEYDEATSAAMASLPIRGSFTVDQGLCEPGQDPHLLPRVEIFAGDTILDFVLKLRFGWSPISSVGKIPFRRILKRKLRELTGKTTPLP